jgi:DNA-3-methyladenine glycosylase II
LSGIDSFIVSVPDAFDFGLCLGFLKRSSREILHRCEGDYVEKLIEMDNRPVLFRLRDHEDRSLRVDILNTSLTRDIRATLELYIRDWFDLDTDLRPFYDMASTDDHLRELIKQFRGYRIVGYPDLFESLVWAVLGQQINVAFAYLLKQRLVEQYGDRLQVNGSVYHLFPDPYIISRLTDSDLLPLQFSRQKSKYTVGIAEAFASGSISREMLQGLTCQEAKERLMRIKGVGNWTASYALMKTFHYPDAFPLEDAGLHNAIKKQLKLDRKPSLDEVRAMFKKYSGWEAYATLYFWRSL